MFGALGKISNLKNKDGRRYIFQDYYTPKVNETRGRYQQIFDMYQDNPAQQEKMEVTKKGLAIGKQTYQKKIQTPTVNEVLKMDLQDLREALSVKIGQSDQINEQGSAFLGFTISAKSFEEIRKAYIKLKIVHAGARHIVCAYSIPGTDRHHTK